MNVVYWDNEYISAFTDFPCAKPHKHWMIQLFFCMGSEVEVQIDNIIIRGNCIVINSNVKHSFNAQGNVYYTMIIDPMSKIAFNLREQYIDKRQGFGLIDVKNMYQKYSDLTQFIENVDKLMYLDFRNTLISTMLINYVKEEGVFDKRVEDIILFLKDSDYYDYSVKALSDKVNLSESRFTHLFKEYTGIPLKGYLVLLKWKRAYEDMIVNGNITSAALDAGFDSPSHFASANRKLTGMTAHSVSKNSRFLKV